jgi:rubrerythrin
MSVTDAAQLDIRGAFDFAIMVEEDALVRYEQLAALLGQDAGGAGDVFRAMAVNEAKHRAELEAHRAAVFRAGPPRIEVTVLDAAIERPELEDGELPRTAREALLLALGAERRSFAFYRDALQHIDDRAVAYFFRQLMEEEAEHVALLEAKIARLAPSQPAAPPGRPAPAPCAPPPEPYPDRALLLSILPRFDVATQVVASRVILDGVPQEEVAEELGVSRRTVAVKLARFVSIARQHLAVALAAATLVGCSPPGLEVDAPAAVRGWEGSATATASAALGTPSPPSGAAPADPTSGAAPEAAAAPGGVDPFSRTPTAPQLQPDGTPARPQLANVSPASGAPAGGGEVLITGSGFSNVQVMFGSTVARVLNQSSNAVTVVAPEGAEGPCTVVVTNRDGTYAVAASAYTYR